MHLRFLAKMALISRWIHKHQRYRMFIIIISVIIGLTVGVAASLMKVLVLSLKGLITSHTAVGQANPLFFILPIIGILLTIGFVKYIIRDDVRHGIPRILYVIAHKKGRMRKHKTFSSFIGGALTSSFGGSAGLESPIISTGAAMGSYFSQIMRLDFKTTTLLIGCGAAGAISSIFYTPIAAVIFGVEVLMLDLTTASIIPLLGTTITGAITANSLMPQEAIFQFSVQDSAGISDLPFLIILGIITGLLSIYFNRVSYGLQVIMNRKRWKNRNLIIGLFLLGFLIYLFPPLYGEGYDVLKLLIKDGPKNLLDRSFFESFNDNFYIVTGFVILVLFAKVFTTSLTIETGGIGGIFAPTVFTGGIAGYIFATVADKVYPQWHLSPENYSIVGMAGVLGGVLHAPLTAIFFAAEITNGYTLMLPIMLVTAIAFTTNRIFDNHSIFTRQLAEQGSLLTHHKDKNVLTLLPINSVIDKDFISVSPKTTLGDLTKKISEASRNIFPVVDEESNFLGVVTLDEVRKDMFDKENYRKTMDMYMIQPLAQVCTKDSMEDVMMKFSATHYFNMPVIDNGKYIGFVSRSNTFAAYRKTLLDITMD